MELSRYQEAILNAVQQRTKASIYANLRGVLIEALAGTGKSFILVKACQILADAGIGPEEVRLVVFGRKNKADLQSKLGMQCGAEWAQSSVSTINSLGFQILKDATGIPNSAWKVESNKYTKIARELGYLSRFEFSKGKRSLILGNNYLFKTDKLPIGLDAQSLEREFEDCSTSLGFTA
jgi:superfamily I DNA/RNA helicase